LSAGIERCVKWTGKDKLDEIVKLKSLTFFALNRSAFTMGFRIRTKTLGVILIAFGLVLTSTTNCSAQGVNFGNPAAPPPPPVFAPVPSPLTSLTGFRKTLDSYGVTISGIYTTDVFGNVNGGIRTGATYQGLLELDLDIDLAKSIGLKGGSFHISGFEIHGASLSKGYTGDLSTVSNIDGYDTARFAEYWYEQSMFDDRFSLKIGQFLADNEFYYSDYSNLFICASFGAYTFVVNNYPFVPTYPLSAPGVRLLWHPIPQLDIKMGLYSGSTLSEKTNNSGLPNISGRDGIMTYWEADYKINHEANASGLPGTYKLGCMFHSRYDGFLNSNPDSSDRSGYGFYATIDQAIWQKAITDKQAKAPSLGLFCRIGFMPPEFGFVSRYVDAGFNYNGLFAGRNEDIFGVGVTHSGISREANRNNQGGSHYTSETLIEVTYSAKLTSWLTLQPDFQYIFNPGGTFAARNATVIGLRSTLTF
jgi:porin